MHRTAISIGVVKLLPKSKVLVKAQLKLTKDSKKDGQVNQVWVPTGDRAMENSLRASRQSVTKYFLRNGIYQVLRDLTLLHNDEVKNENKML